ncbi:hypothetical protein PoB_001268300 [Plakobranchus ocellatus]|uniref:Uncharacterized protein n=1 Tax=Plakobranchus ocellatus TaxID=259542 RepID=A0AAV3YUE2_9GAST|nr:hypothetical protein PoB_001268300 [Plakobranchus ocellatus]
MVLLQCCRCSVDNSSKILGSFIPSLLPQQPSSGKTSQPLSSQPYPRRGPPQQPDSQPADSHHPSVSHQSRCPLGCTSSTG